MSAGSGIPNDPNTGGLKVNNDLKLLAPKFKSAVEKALADCKAAGLPAIVWEATRSQALQNLYYSRGRTIIPPTHTVTNAPTIIHSWHGYGLAVDVIHETKFWEPDDGEAWFKKVAVYFKTAGCSWGGDWTHPDTPHFQWGLCKPSPSIQAQEMLVSQGKEAVWAAVQAM